MFRTHLFGTPSIIVYTSTIHKFMLYSKDKFKAEWPTIELMGRNSLVAVHGKAHTQVHNFVTNAINRPDALNRIVALVQPRMVAALQSWAQMDKIKARFETQKMTFENIGKLFFSKEPGPFLHSLDKLYQDLLLGVRAYPINIPGFAYHHALQCRRKLDDFFWIEIDNRKNKDKVETIDLMDGLMQIEDDDGDKLSDKEVVDNIVSLVAAGYLSTSLASTWAIYLLAKYPIVLKKA
ncbi:putative cytochrome P450 [Medicago truncatula]|uniref:Putative cytochrome P450 n=1 Tax=Medicago truncatula TaxID=3880 RepID=A0A396IPL6_MEDTR|nr:putative cytochrome P450 [Medicago truncatula]